MYILSNNNLITKTNIYFNSKNNNIKKGLNIIENIINNKNKQNYYFKSKVDRFSNINNISELYYDCSHNYNLIKKSFNFKINKKKKPVKYVQKDSINLNKSYDNCNNNLTNDIYNNTRCISITPKSERFKPNIVTNIRKYVICNNKEKDKRIRPSHFFKTSNNRNTFLFNKVSNVNKSYEYIKDSTPGPGYYENFYQKIKYNKPIKYQLFGSGVERFENTTTINDLEYSKKETLLKKSHNIKYNEIYNNIKTKKEYNILLNKNYNISPFTYNIIGQFNSIKTKKNKKINNNNTTQIINNSINNSGLKKIILSISNNFSNENNTIIKKKINKQKIKEIKNNSNSINRKSKGKLFLKLIREYISHNYIQNNTPKNNKKIRKKNNKLKVNK